MNQTSPWTEAVAQTARKKKIHFLKSLPQIQCLFPMKHLYPKEVIQIRDTKLKSKLSGYLQQ